MIALDFLINKNAKADKKIVNLEVEEKKGIYELQIKEKEIGTFRKIIGVIGDVFSFIGKKGYKFFSNNDYNV